MRVVYFAWIRERVGIDEETCDPPEGVQTGLQLTDWLKGRNASYALAFADVRRVRMACDQKLMPLDTALDGVQEVAFFPPMTGG